MKSMYRLKIFSWIIFSLMFLGLAVSEKANGLDITLMHINDTHSHIEETATSLLLDGKQTYLNIGGMARLATKVKEIRTFKPGALLLHAGDAVQGTLYFTQYKGQADFNFLNEIGVDVMVLGNHEFDRGPETIASFIDMAQFPIISANVDVQNEPLLANQIPSYITKDINGSTLAVIGLTTTKTSEISSPGEQIQFTNEIAAAQTIIDELHQNGINAIVLLTHMGFHEDIQLAESLEGVDIIIGGHDHALLGDFENVGLESAGNYPTMTQDDDGNQVCILQAWEWGKILGVLDVSFDDNGHVISCAGNPIILSGDDFVQKDDQGNKVPVDSQTRDQLNTFIVQQPNIEIIAQDSGIIETLNMRYKPEIEIFKQTVVATVSDDLLHIREPGKHVSGELLLKGSMIAPHVCESMCWFAENNMERHVDMSLQNAGGVRIDISEGDLTVADIYALLPFGNQLVIMEVTGAEIKEALEIGAGNSSGAFPYVGRARFAVDMNRPFGERIVSLKIKNQDNQWIPVVPEQTYTIITNDYLAGGGDGYLVLKNTQGFREDTGFIDAEVFQAYAEHLSVLSPLSDTGIYYMHMLKTASTDFHIQPLGTYNTHEYDESAAEIPSFDPVSKRLFMVNGSDGSVDIMDMSDPFLIDCIKKIDLSPYGKAANSCAFKDGMLAVAVENIVKQDAGKVVIFDADGNFLKQFAAGALPDMIKFTPDGKTILVANEGEPDDDYDNDPEGSITIVDLTNGLEQATSFQADFKTFNSEIDNLRQAGVRIYGLTSTVAQDVEPEYIAVSKDSKTAWISLQENNALAVLDIDSKTITHILPFGYKDHRLPENTLDVSDKDDCVHMSTWPIFGMYMPDSIEAFKIGDTHYIVTANEGDSRDYDGFSEEARVKDIVLDPENFPDSDELQKSENLGRLKISTVIGDDDGDGDYDRLFSYGGRSFSIWKQEKDQLILVYDSKNEFEEIINAILLLKFGQSEKALLSDDRSDDKGAEPEGIAVGEVNGRIYAFIGLERFSGLMIYDISNPEEARFIQFVSRQNLNQELETGLAEDVSPEGVLFISAEDSPNGKPLLVLGNEVSGTTTVYEISGSGNEIQLIPPKAIAGPDRDDIMGKQVLLDASHSNHDNGVIVGYEWKQISGPTVNIHNPFSPITTFDSSTIETSIEALIFQLTVSDLNGLTATTEVTINLVKNMSISPVIQMLKILANFDEPLSLYWDLNNDKKIGFEDLLFILNDVSR